MSSRGKVSTKRLTLVPSMLLAPAAAHILTRRTVFTVQRHLTIAVKQLMPNLVSARDRELSFEKIARPMQSEIAPSTLRAITSSEHPTPESGQNAQHREKVAHTGEAINEKVLERHTEHANALALRRAHLGPGNPLLVTRPAWSPAESAHPAGISQAKFDSMLLENFCG